MNQCQETDRIRLETKADFKYGDLRINLQHRREGSRAWSEIIEPIVDISWKGELLGGYESLSVGLVDTFNAVRACRPGIASIVGDDRSAVLLALSALGELIGVEIHGHSDTPEIETRMHPEDERLCEAFKHWDDRPQVVVSALVSSTDPYNFNNEGIRYRIRMTASHTTFEHNEHMSARDPIDLNPLLIDLMIKHFA